MNNEPKQTAKLTKEQEERFDERVNEVRRDMPDPDDPNAPSDWEGPIRYFGQHVLRGDEFFTITDFGHIKQHLADELQRQREEIEAKLNEIMDDDSIAMLEENMRLAFGQNECRVCGYNPRHQKKYLMQALQTTNEEEHE